MSHVSMRFMFAASRVSFYRRAVGDPLPWFRSNACRINKLFEHRVGKGLPINWGIVKFSRGVVHGVRGMCWLSRLLKTVSIAREKMRGGSRVVVTGGDRDCVSRGGRSIFVTVEGRLFNRGVVNSSKLHTPTHVTERNSRMTFEPGCSVLSFL